MPKDKKAAGVPPARKPTQRTIADELGLAVTTVSKALAGDPHIAASTRTEVAQVARRLGYVPDRAAQRLRTGRTNVITLVLDPHSELLDFGASLIEGIAEVVRTTRYHLTIMQYQLGEDILDPIDFLVRNRLADGLIFARTKPDDKRVRFLLDRGFPFITHGRTKIEGHAWYDYDNDAFAQMAVDALVGAGARHIGLIPPSASYTYRDFMVQGLDEAAARHGIRASTPRDFDLNHPSDILYSRLVDWLRQPDRPDALICPGEVSAMAAHAALIDLGLSIPLVAKQTSPVFEFLRPRPYVIGEDIQAAGRVMTKALLELIAGAAPEGHQILHVPTDPALHDDASGLPT